MKTKRKYFLALGCVVTAILFTAGTFVSEFTAMAITAVDPMLFPITAVTRWESGFGRALEYQNRYNNDIVMAVSQWPGMDPLILKSLLIQESNMRHHRINRYGYAGIAQLGRHEAQSVGLRVGRGNDERLHPSKAIGACVRVMRKKAQWLEKTVFARYGRPVGDEYWKFIAAAYNGGEGTVARAMRYAYTSTKPAAVRFSDLAQAPGGNIYKSPLCRAMPSWWPKRSKYREITHFAFFVVRRARQ